jgi:probable rRNA maturation factor
VPTGRVRLRPPRVMVSGTGRAGSALAAADAVRATRHVLRGERARGASVSVRFLTVQEMRALNRRALGRDRATDVIAFPLAHTGGLVADVYVCPGVARRAARQVGASRREEELRLVVHGVLHALGHRHPEGPGRTRSAMWQRQERYVAALARSGRA